MGKTSIINTVENDLKDEVSCIRINLLDFDEIDHLFQYFFAELKCILRKKEAYVGVGSQITKYTQSYFLHKTGVNISTILGRVFDFSRSNYRDQKRELNEVIKNVMGKENIVVIIDDIERCSSENIFRYIFFAKEIAGLSNCGTIFLTDYMILQEMIKQKELRADFLDKFFDYKIEVPKIEYIEVVNYYMKKHPVPSEFDSKFKTDISEWIQKTLKWIESTEKFVKTGENKGNEATILIKKIKSTFLEPLTNPRKCNKLMESIVSDVKRVIECTESVNDDEIVVFGNNIKIQSLLFLNSYIKCFCIIQYAEIKSSSWIDFIGSRSKDIEKIDDLFCLDFKDDREQLIVFLCECVIQLEKRDNKYLSRKKMLFLDTFEKENNIAYIVNDYKDQVEEWVKKIRCDNIKGITEDNISVLEKLLYNKSSKDSLAMSLT